MIVPAYHFRAPNLHTPSATHIPLEISERLRVLCRVCERDESATNIIIKCCGLSKR